MYLDLDALKAAAPIIPYVKKHYSKEFIIDSETGGILTTLCRWHKEKTGSLKFFANGTYKCFGCGEHGDIFNLVQTMENVDFEESCKIVGDNVGYEVSLAPANPYYEAYKTTMNNHARRYWYNLQCNQEVLQYLEDRGITKETRNEFRLGFTDSQEYKYRKDIGGIQNRISFPILEPKAINPKCIGMAYRTIQDIKPKYINDKNQEGRDGQDPNLSGVFIKGNALYGYSQAYTSIKSNGYAILTEGYMDAISMHQSNIKNTVAAMGTSVTEAQIKLLSKITKNILLILDGDGPGVDAALRILPVIFAEGMNANLCVLPNSMDPADICKDNDFNENKIRKIIKEYTTPALKYILEKEIASYESFVLRERLKVKENMSKILNNVSNENLKEVYTDLMNKRLDMGR